MDTLQATEWEAAQAVSISVDLVASARQELELLANVNQNPCLYGGPAVTRAIERYWLLYDGVTIGLQIILDYESAFVGVDCNFRSCRILLTVRCVQDASHILTPLWTISLGLFLSQFLACVITCRLSLPSPMGRLGASKKSRFLPLLLYIIYVYIYISDSPIQEQTQSRKCSLEHRQSGKKTPFSRV